MSQQNNNVLIRLGAYAIFVPLLILSFIYISNVVPVADLNTEIGVQDEVDYGVSENWSDYGLFSGDISTDSDLIWADSSSSGEWDGRIQELQTERTGYIELVGDARSGSGELSLNLYNNQPDNEQVNSRVDLNESSAFQDYTGVSSYSWNHTNPESDSDVLVVSTGLNTDTEADGVSSVSYGGQSLTRLQNIYSQRVGSDVWYLLDPPTGTYDLTVQKGSTTESVSQARSYTGVSQDSPFRDQATNSGKSSSFSTGVQTDHDGDLVIDSVTTQADFSPSQNQSYTYGLTTAGDNKRFEGSYKRGSDLVDMAWSGGGNSGWVHSVASLRAEQASISNPDDVIGVELKTGSTIEQIDLRNYTHYEVEISLSEESGLDNKKPNVDRFNVHLESLEQNEQGVNESDSRNILYLLWGFGVLMFVFGMYKAIKLRSEL